MARTAGRMRYQVGQVIKGMVGVGVLLFVTGAENVGAADQKDNPGARAAFLAAYKVFMDPRCMHCHPAGDAPLQGDDSHPHAQNVKRGPDGGGKYGVKCGACHQTTNLPGSNMPPGVSSKWHMPPPNMRMVFEGKSPGALCRQLKDRRLNGGKTIEGAIEHLEADPLVLWGWAPGDGRSTPPLSHAEFVQKMRDWVHKGAACPQ
jgi:hypothetical protein